MRNRESVVLANGHLSEDDAASDNTAPEETPTKARRGRPPGSGQKAKGHSNGQGPQSQHGTPEKFKSNGLFSTPVKAVSGIGNVSAPTVGIADRSARRKSARTLVERTATDGFGDEDAEEEDVLASKIWDADKVESEDQQEETDGEPGDDDTVPTTPSKRKKGRR